MSGLPRPSKRVLVLFGATGDLAKRKLFPGFFHLFREGLMPEDFRIIGSGRHSPGSDDDFRQHINEALQQYGRGELDEHWDDFAARLSFVASSAEDGSDLARAVNDAEGEIGAEGERLVYLSVPPGAMQDMVRMLGETGIAENCSLVVEKPFGHDVASAKELNATLHEVLDEDSIYRIDHFLGKEAAQNILALRFANGIFEPVWNRDHIAYIQIDVPEALDIQGRAGFYEQTGAFRDMVVTHLLQILGIVALEPPSRIDAEAAAPGAHQAVRGDPAAGPRRGWCSASTTATRTPTDVADDSQVETFAALEVWVDTWRWSGVPFYLRTGKSLAEGRRTVTIGFTDAPLRLFPDHTPEQCVRPSELVFELSDDPKVRIEVQAKVPGPVIDLGRVALTLDVEEAFDGEDGLEAYERLLHDVMLRERLLFTRAEQIERLWEVCAPVIEQPPEVQPYEPGLVGTGGGDRAPGVARVAPARRQRRLNVTRGRGGRGATMMIMLLVTLAMAMLALAAAGRSAARATTSSRPTLTSNRALARVQAAELLRRTPVPAGATPTAANPGSHFWLDSPADGVPDARAADAHRYWSLAGDPRTIFEQIKAHPPAGARISASGTGSANGIAQSWDVTFSFPAVPGRILERGIGIELSAGRQRRDRHPCRRLRGVGDPARAE